jgi:[ribosomal protein S18]-alanine N-acetyltransferase
MSAWSVRRATSSDIHASLLSIEHASQPSPWSAQQFEEEIASSASWCWVLHEGATVHGFICYRRMVDEVELLNVAVAPASRRRGVGEALVRILLREADAMGVTRVVLEVRVSNTAARSLYARLGFAPLGVRRGYYRDNGEDALVLGLPLEPLPVE